MSEAGGVHLERDGAVLEIIIDRPPVNAIDDELSRAIYGALRALQDDDSLAVGVLGAAGERVFSAGWDLKQVAGEGAGALHAPPPCPGGFAGITEFWDLHKPVIAAVGGAAVGGGFEIALACDLIVAARDAEFWLPDMQRGFLPTSGAVQRLPRRLPYNVAVDLLLTGRHMSAEEACRWGLVHSVVDATQVLGHARALAHEVARGAPLALQALKEVLAAIGTLPLVDAFARTDPAATDLPLYRRMLESADAVEGPRAFAEKRAPRWQGR